MSKAKPVFWIEGKRTFKSLSEAARNFNFQDTAFHIASRTTDGVFEFCGQHFRKTLMTAEDKTLFVLENLKKADDLLEQTAVEMNDAYCSAFAKSLVLVALKKISMAILLTKEIRGKGMYQSIDSIKKD